MGYGGLKMSGETQVLLKTEHYQYIVKRCPNPKCPDNTDISLQAPSDNEIYYIKCNCCGVCGPSTLLIQDAIEGWGKLIRH